MTVVTVVTPAYNAQPFIEEAMRSVHAQTHRPLEHLVVDDASTDATAALVTTLAGELTSPDYRVTLLSHQQNQGAASALVHGVEAANGDAVGWLSADDAYVDPRKTSEQLELLEHSDVVFDTQFRTGAAPGTAGLVRARWPLAMHASADLRSFRPDALLVGLLFANPINGSSVLLRRHVFRDVATFDLALGNIDADADMWLRLSALNVRMTPRHAPGIFYRRHAGQTSNRVAEMVEGTAISRLRVIEALHERGLLLRLLRARRSILRLATLSGQHRARPAVASALADLYAQAGNVQEPWVRAVRFDLRRGGLLPAPAQMDRLRRRARELQGSAEFQRFLARLDG